MCTAATYKTDDFYMGRTLDYEFSYGEEITVMPRRFPLEFRHGGRTDEHYAMIGTAHVSDGYPMYYDAVNEKGLGMTGLNFAVSAHYAEPQDGKQNIAQFEFIPWVLSQYATIEQARSLSMFSPSLTGTIIIFLLLIYYVKLIISERKGHDATICGCKITSYLSNNQDFSRLFAQNRSFCGILPIFILSKTSFSAENHAFRYRSTTFICRKTSLYPPDALLPSTIPGLRLRDKEKAFQKHHDDRYRAIRFLLAEAC